MIHRVIAARVPNRDLLPEATPRAGGWTVDDAFGYCERIARGHAENFPVASRFVPAPLRRYVYAVYAFARAADDFADEPQYEGRRAAMLDEWEAELERCFHGEAEHPVFVALRDTVEKRDVPISPLRDLLTAFRMDLHVRRHPTFASLRNYCVHSAEAVGRLLLYIFDYRDPSLLRYADDLSTGLQLAKMIQDVKLDGERGRLYLPLEDLSHFEVGEEELRAGRMSDGVRDLLRFQTARARSILERGRPITRKVGRDLGFELSLAWHCGQAMLEKIEAADHDVFTTRPTLETLDRMRVVARAAAQRWPRPAGS